MIYGANAAKNKAYLIITGAFAIGMITGSLLMNLVAASSAKPVAKKQTTTEELSATLTLTADQKLKIDEIYKESKRQGKEVFKAIQPQMDQINEQTKNKIKGILTPDQAANYDNWCRAKDLAKKATANQGK